MSLRLTIAVLLGMNLVGSASAQQACFGRLRQPGTWCQGCAPVPKCCPDYCRKPFPLFPCPVPLGCNDYCRKPFPPFPCPVPRGCDDYCRKPCPECTPGPCNAQCITLGCPCMPRCSVPPSVAVQH